MKVDDITVHKRIFVASLLAVLCLAVGAAAMPLGSVYSAKADMAVPVATPDPDEVLTEESAGALIDEYAGALFDALVDEEAKVNEIVGGWNAANLAGKTRGQAMTLLFVDVKRVVSDTAVRDQIMNRWKNGADGGDAEPEPEPTPAPVPVRVPPVRSAPNGGQPVAAPPTRGAGTLSPAQDTQRFDAIKKVPMPSRSWTFNTKAGPITFSYSGSGGVAEFKPNRSVGNATVGWIQVCRTGGRDRWYASEADVRMLTTPHDFQNFLLRTDAVFGFRVDRIKGENSPFWEQRTIRSGESLNNYKLAFDYPPAFAKAGGATRFSDNPGVVGGLMRVSAADPRNLEYRFYFLLSPINVETGEIYGTIEWGMVLQGPGNQLPKGLEPSLVTNIPELRGRDLAFDRWNTIFARQYQPGFGMAQAVYPIPGRGVSWGN